MHGGVGVLPTPQQENSIATASSSVYSTCKSVAHHVPPTEYLLPIAQLSFSIDDFFAMTFVEVVNFAMHIVLLDIHKQLDFVR